MWDLALERDLEEEAQYLAQLKQKQVEIPEDLPPQLLCVHQVNHLLRQHCCVSLQFSPKP